MHQAVGKIITAVHISSNNHFLGSGDAQMDIIYEKIKINILPIKLADHYRLLAM